MPRCDQTSPASLTIAIQTVTVNSSPYTLPAFSSSLRLINATGAPLVINPPSVPTNNSTYDLSDWGGDAYPNFWTFGASLNGGASGQTILATGGGNARLDYSSFNGWGSA